MKETVIAILLYCVTANAANSCFEVDAAKQKIVKYTCNTTDVVIPDAINGVHIKIIGEDAFKGMNLKSVKLPSGIENIEDGAFYGNNLSKVKIPKKVKYIGNDVFGRNELDSIAFTEGYLIRIGERAFYANRLTNVKIPDGLETIGKKAFAENKISSLYIPDSVFYIDGAAFSDNQLSKVEIPVTTTLDLGERGGLEHQPVGPVFGYSGVVITRRPISTNLKLTVDGMLFKAIEDGSLKNVKTSVALGADPSSITYRNRVLWSTYGLGGWGAEPLDFPVSVSALAYAISLGNYKISEHLLKLLKIKNDQSWIETGSYCSLTSSISAIKETILVNSPQIAKLLRQYYSDIGSTIVGIGRQNGTALEFADLMKRSEIVKVLLDTMKITPGHINEICDVYHALQNERENAPYGNYPVDVLIKHTRNLCSETTKKFKTQNPNVSTQQLCEGFQKSAYMTYRPFFYMQKCLDYFNSNIFSP
jgi:hypothetical protein